jgi:predicted transcriptional regulator
MPVRTIYLPDDLDAAVTAVAEAMDGDDNRSTAIQNALRKDPAIRAALIEAEDLEAADV